MFPFLGELIELVVLLFQRAYRCLQIAVGAMPVELDEQTIATSATHATDGVDLNSDLYASEDYRRHLAQVYTKRAIQAALASVT